MEIPRPRSRVHKNARRVLGGDDVMAMAMAMATRAWMMTETDDGEGEASRRRALARTSVGEGVKSK
jgi:hypothetical protein